MEAATEALAERTPEEAVLIQEDINFKELGRKPLLWLMLPLALLAWLFISQKIILRDSFVLSSPPTGDFPGYQKWAPTTRVAEFQRSEIA